jgi:hypothetical protein
VRVFGERGTTMMAAKTTGTTTRSMILLQFMAFPSLTALGDNENGRPVRVIGWAE